VSVLVDADTRIASINRNDADRAPSGQSCVIASNVGPPLILGLELPLPGTAPPIRRAPTGAMELTVDPRL
jgi:hypothetical protein